MLKTNSKDVREKIRVYILWQTRDSLIDDYHIPYSEVSTFSKLAKKILQIWQEETKYDYRVRKYGYTFDVFERWAQGLALNQLFIYYYNTSAVYLLRLILEETEAEASKFTERQAEQLLTKLIYRELINDAQK